MPDRPDWSKYLVGSERHSLQDMGELAARLGSIVTFDRRGEIVWMNKFDSGLAEWRPFLAGNDDTITLVADYPYRGNYCAELETQQEVLRGAGIYAYIYPPTVNKWGAEVAFWIKQAFHTFGLELNFMDGTIAYTAAVQLDGQNDEIEVYNSSEAWEVVGTFKTLTSIWGLYHNLKLVGDFDTGYYTRLILDANEIDLSAILMSDPASGPGPLNTIKILFIGDKSGNDKAMVGYAIVTANEP